MPAEWRSVKNMLDSKFFHKPYKYGFGYIVAPAEWRLE